MTQGCSKFKFISYLFLFPLRLILKRLGINYNFPSLTNIYYGERFDMIPATEKAVILPHCLIDAKCPARFSKEEGILCIKCKKCRCGEICSLAEEQGWQFFITPSTGFTKRLVQRKKINAALGAACEFEIEKGIRSTPINAEGIKLQKNKVIPQIILTARYDCLKNDVNWEHLKKIIRGEKTARDY